MSNEKQIQGYETKQLIDELSRMPDMVIATAYLEAINYALYGVNVTEAWNTAIQQKDALDRAYAKGYNDGLEAAAHTDNSTMSEYVSEDIKERIEHYEKQDGHDVSEEDIVNGHSKEEINKMMWDKVRNLGYKEGLAKAWEVAKRIELSEDEGGIPNVDLYKMFKTPSLYPMISRGMTIYDIIEAIDRYDEQNKIHVGDEVKIINTEEAFVVTQILPTNIICGIDADGSVFSLKKEQLKKTGNHFAEVSKLLEALRGGKTE